MTRAELLAALAAASGPDRALDDAIWTFVTDQSSHIETPAYGAYGVPNKHRRQGLPRYTDTLDAGRSLLAPGTLWAVGDMEEGPFARLCVPNSKGTYEGGYVEAKAATVELALCIAALSARSAP